MRKKKIAPSLRKREIGYKGRVIIETGGFDTPEEAQVAMDSLRLPEFGTEEVNRLLMRRVPIPINYEFEAFDPDSDESVWRSYNNRKAAEKGAEELGVDPADIEKRYECRHDGDTMVEKGEKAVVLISLMGNGEFHLHGVAGIELLPDDDEFVSVPEVMLMAVPVLIKGVAKFGPEVMEKALIGLFRNLAEVMNDDDADGKNLMAGFYRAVTSGETEEKGDAS